MCHKRFCRIFILFDSLEVYVTKTHYCPALTLNNIWGGAGKIYPPIRKSPIPDETFFGNRFFHIDIFDAFWPKFLAVSLHTFEAMTVFRRAVLTN